MNDYTFALVKEIAAQKAGYVPSPVWGRLVSKSANSDRVEEYNLYSVAEKPTHLPVHTDTYNKIMTHIHNIKAGTSDSSDFKKHLLPSQPKK
jgi:hypothetical protein